MQLISLPAIQGDVVNAFNIIQGFFFFKECEPIIDVSIKIKCLEKHKFSVENVIVLLLM